MSFNSQNMHLYTKEKNNLKYAFIPKLCNLKIKTRLFLFIFRILFN